MSRFLSIKPTKSLMYSSFILLVLVGGGLGYSYYYVPKNKQIIQKDGFLTLQILAANIAEKHKDRQKLYKNILSQVYKIKEKDRQARVDTLLEFMKVDASAQYNINGAPKKNKSKPADVSIEGEKLIYRAWEKRDELLISEPIANFLQPVLATQKDELFSSYALAWVDNSKHSALVYHDDNLGIRSDIPLDTLLFRNVQGYLAGIRDIQSPEFNHKIFYYPFRVGTVQLVLCGFARQDLYQQHVRKVPFYFVYPLAILFLLLLVFLPALKFYIMDTDEQVRVSDVVLFGLSVVVGASVLTLIIIQYLQWQGEEEIARRNLRTLSTKIEMAFEEELSEAYACADTLNAFRKRTTQESISERDLSLEVQQFVRNSLRSPHFYLFDRISWVDSLGIQRIKAEMVGKPVFTNVKERNYFKVFRNDDAFTLPDGSDTTKPFGWEPIYSHTNADFNITISQPTDGYIVALASKMYSVVNVLLPIGYGFCMIDSDGKVMLHSNVSRNLRENLFEKAVPAIELRGFAAARQEADINEVSLYQNGYMLHIRPVKGLPYSFVTFYDKGFIVPVNMRILIFAFMFSVLSGVTCGMLWLILARTNLRSHPLLFCPMDYLTWLIPRKRMANYYVHGLVFLVVYMVSSLVFSLLLTHISSYTRFITIMLTPINVIGGLHVIGATCRQFNRQLSGPPQLENNQRRLMGISTIHLAISAAFYWISDSAGYPIDIWPFLVFQGVANGWMWGYIFFSHTYLLPSYHWKDSYPVSYTLMLTALVVNLAVLPSALYSWYGYQQEQVQTLKKQQLHLANNIRERGRQLTNVTQLARQKIITDDYVEKRLIREGIYTTNVDLIALVDHAPPDSGSFDPFYSTIAENLSNRYYDPKQYPTLADSSTDMSWQWAPVEGRICLWYRNPLPKQAVTNSDPCYLYLASALPDNSFFSLGNSFGSIGSLVLLSALLLWGLYEWLRTNIENVFLTRFVRAYAPDEPSQPVPDVSDGQPAPDAQKDKETNPWIPDDWNVIARNREHINGLGKRERDAARHVRLNEIGYEYKWRKRRQKEKCLLYDFAYDGLLNYKNTDDIRRLIDENILTINDERLRFSDPGFRAFLINKQGTDELKALQAKYQQNSTWRSLQGALLLLLAGFAGFVLLTQEAAFNKILALAAGVTTLLSVLPKIFNTASDKVDDKS